MSLTGKTTDEKVWNYLKSKGLNDYGIAGLMGNLQAESGIIFNRVEILCLKRLKEQGKTYTDKTYTEAVDSGKISKAEFLNPLPSKQYGYGLVQWTSKGRKEGLYDLAKSRKVSIADPEMQLDYLYKELSESYSSVLKVLETATSVKQASDIVLTKFEMPADCGTAVKNTRSSYGQKFYNQYARNTGSATHSGAKVSPDALIKVAEGELGYLEKDDTSNLDDKYTPGSRNMTKYWRDMADLGLGNYQGSYWCACFVHWCFYKAFGLKASQELLLQNFYINCQEMYDIAYSHGQIYTIPEVGDVALFWKTNQYGHTGIVAEVNGDLFTTDEGNTSGGSTVVANGGGVFKKTYNINSLTKVRFMRPKYDTVTSGTDIKPSGGSGDLLKKGSTGKEVKKVQKWLNFVGGYGLELDGEFGTKTYNAVVDFQKKYKLDVDGIVGEKTLKALKKAVKAIKADDDDLIETGEVIVEEGTVVDSGIVNRNIGSVTATKLNVRSWYGEDSAGNKYPVIKSCPYLLQNEKVKVEQAYTYNGKTWYKVTINNDRTGGKNVVGFVSGDYVELP